MTVNISDIHKYLEVAGVKHSRNGYRYAVMAIKIGAEQPELFARIRDVYSVIAEKYNQKPENIGSAIRNSIKSTNLANKEFIAKAIVDITERGKN